MSFREVISDVKEKLGLGRKAQEFSVGTFGASYVHKRMGANPHAEFEQSHPRSDDACPANANRWMGANPHAEFEQMHPAVNKEEPAAFANACESGAKKASEAQMGKPMPEPTFHCQ